jgi:hypothetical protein
MSDQSQLLTRAARLLSLALKACEEGHFDCAERFTQRASEILSHPTALERLGTQDRNAPHLARLHLQHRKAD